MSAADPVNILLVDDQPARLLSYQAILEGLGHNLVPASSGLEALRKLMDQEFALVLLDVSMPGMDGFETASLIHEHPRYERTPIIFVTGVHVTELDRLKGYRTGAVDYVYVPVIPEILRSKVSVLVELHNQRRELQLLNRSLEATNARLEHANRALEAQRTRELEEMNRNLSHANAQLASANRALEEEVGERRRAEAALLEADRQKNEFIAILAHELRNPLAPIVNAVKIMGSRPMADSKIAWARAVVERQSQQLGRLVDDLLDVSRITKGTINLQRERLEVATVIRRAVETTQPYFDEHGHTLTLEVPEHALYVDGDLVRLTQVVGNLLANAAKYTDPGGRIRIEVDSDDDRVRIRVRDNGIGIPAEKIPSLFRPFSQVDRVARRSQSGLGLGLSLVRKLVELHGGTVSVVSGGADQGSEFTVQLPRSGACTAPEPDRTVGADPAPHSTPRLRILLADDNRDALQSLELLLQERGYETHVAEDGAAALDRAEAVRPHAALLDLGMPGIDGFEVARRLRARPWGARMLLVAITGWGQGEDRRRSSEAGFDAHLTKPVDFDQLHALIGERSWRIGDSPTLASGGTMRRSPERAGGS